MRKIKTIEIGETYCDFCDLEGSDSAWIHKCEICGKDICETCTNYIDTATGGYLMLCKDCATIDLSEYHRVKAEIKELEEYIEKKRDECENILEKIRTNTKEA